MPVKTGIQVHLSIKFEDLMDSGFHRNDGQISVPSQAISLLPF